MDPQFKVDSIEIKKSRAYVRATIITPIDFAVCAGCMLGGVRVSPEEFREPREGTFIFRLESVSDAESLTVDDKVFLSRPR